MKITVRYFDEERLKIDWDNYISDPIVIITTPSGDIKCRGNMCPLDKNWNSYFSDKEIETERFERFFIDDTGHSWSGYYFIRIDNDYLYENGPETKSLYLWEELKKGEAILNEYRLKCNRDKIEWFILANKLINREKNLDKILNDKIRDGK